MREYCRFRGRPFRKTSPSYGAVFFPATMSRSVVLPHPLGPMSATMLPEANTPLIGDRINFLSFSPVRPLRTVTSKLTSRKARWLWPDALAGSPSGPRSSETSETSTTTGASFVAPIALAASASAPNGSAPSARVRLWGDGVTNSSSLSSTVPSRVMSVNTRPTRRETWVHDPGARPERRARSRYYMRMRQAFFCGKIF